MAFLLVVLAAAVTRGASSKLDGRQRGYDNQNYNGDYPNAAYNNFNDAPAPVIINNNNGRGRRRENKTSRRERLTNDIGTVVSGMANSRSRSAQPSPAPGPNMQPPPGYDAPCMPRGDNLPPPYEPSGNRKPGRS